MQSFSGSPASLLASIRLNRGLILNLARRDVVGRYRGSALGLLWSLFNPILMLAVYTFVFSWVMKARWAGGSDSKTEFALLLFAGLIIFNLFAECFSRAPHLVISNANYVKKVVFPLEILPVVSSCAVFFHTLVSLAVWMLFYLVTNGLPHATVLLLPVVLFPVFMLALAAGWFISALGVYLRDVAQLVSVATTVLMFLSPIFYPIEAIPPKFQVFLNLNPLAPTIAAMRDILYWGRLPDLGLMGIYTLVCTTLAFASYAWFQKVRKGFADVL